MSDKEKWEEQEMEEENKKKIFEKREGSQRRIGETEKSEERGENEISFSVTLKNDLILAHI